MSEIVKWTDLFERYLRENPCEDGSHNLGHFRRVWKSAKNMMDHNVDQLVVLAASYFHDIVTYPKDHPHRSLSSKDAAIKAEEILLQMDFPKEKIENVKHSIESHSFSANITPETVEAKIVQDADRMEALGAIGLARTFYVAGRLGSQLFHEEDPLAHKRELDDKKYALDHFRVKLLKLPATMQTELGRREAQRRANVLLKFTEDLQSEL